MKALVRTLVVQHLNQVIILIVSPLHQRTAALKQNQFRHLMIQAKTNKLFQVSKNNFLISLCICLCTVFVALHV